MSSITNEKVTWVPTGTFGREFAGSTGLKKELVPTRTFEKRMEEI